MGRNWLKVLAAGAEEANGKAEGLRWATARPPLRAEACDCRQGPPWML